MRMALPMPTVSESIVLFWYWTTGVLVVEGVSDEVLEAGVELGFDFKSLGNGVGGKGGGGNGKLE